MFHVGYVELRRKAQWQVLACLKFRAFERAKFYRRDIAQAMVLSLIRAERAT